MMAMMKARRLADQHPQRYAVSPHNGPYVLGCGHICLCYAGSNVVECGFCGLYLTGDLVPNPCQYCVAREAYRDETLKGVK